MCQSDWRPLRERFSFHFVGKHWSSLVRRLIFVGFFGWLVGFASFFPQVHIWTLCFEWFFTPLPSSLNEDCGHPGRVCQWCGNTVTCGFECSCFVGPSRRGNSLEKSCPEFAKAFPRFDNIHPYEAIKASLMGELTFILDCEQKLWPSDCSFEELMGEITQSCLKGWHWSTESTFFIKLFPFLVVVLSCNEACTSVYNVGWKGLGWLSRVMPQKKNKYSNALEFYFIKWKSLADFFKGQWMWFLVFPRGKIAWEVGLDYDSGDFWQN